MSIPYEKPDDAAPDFVTARSEQPTDENLADLVAPEADETAPYTDPAIDEERSAQKQETSDLEEAGAESAPPPPPPERQRKLPPPGPEARIDLFHSHAFLRVEALLQSFSEGFGPVSFDTLDDNDVLSCEYANHRFHVTYCLRERKRDQLRVRWEESSSRTNRSDAELLALARQLAHLLGGGTNLRLTETRSN